MRWRDIRILYVRELRSALREPGVVIGSIVIPMVLYPLILWLIYTGFTFVSGQTAEMNSRVMLVHLPARHEVLRNRLAATASIAIVESPKPQTALKDGSLDALVEFTAEGDSDFRAQIAYDGSSDRSSQAETRVREAIDAYRRDALKRAAMKVGVPREQLQDFSIDLVNRSSNRQMGQFVLALLAPSLLIVMLTAGGLYPAIDATAGELERSTWETLMTAGTARVNIVVSKYLYVATMAMASALLNLAAMTVSLRAILQPLGGASLSFSIPLGSIPLVVLAVALLALFVAAGAMTLASFARNFKEGQSIIAPFSVVIMLPLLFIHTPGAEFSMALALIPVVNVAMMCREAIVGVYHWPQIAVTGAVEVLCVAAAMKLAATVLDFEAMTIGSPRPGLGELLRRWRRRRATA